MEQTYISVEEFNELAERMIDALSPIYDETEVCLFITVLSHALTGLVKLQPVEYQVYWLKQATETMTRRDTPTVVVDNVNFAAISKARQENDAARSELTVALDVLRLALVCSQRTF